MKRFNTASPSIVTSARVFLIVIGLILVSVSTASAQLTGEILKRMEAYNLALVSLRANVLKIDYDPVVKTTDARNGKLLYLKPKKEKPAFKIDWTNKPIETILVINGGYKIISWDRKQVIEGAVENVKGGRDTNDLLSFMNMSREQIKANFLPPVNLNEETLKNGIRAWHLQLTPKVRKNYKLADLWIDANGFPVQSALTGHNGTVSTVLMSDFKTNKSINTSEFKVSTKGMTKVKG